MLSPDGQPLYGNRSLLQYTGLTIAEMTSADFRARVFHPDDVARLREERRGALAGGVPFELEQRARRHDCQYRWFLVQYNPVRDEHGQTLRWYATGTDIDDRKRAEQRVRNENLALREDIDRASMFEEIVGSAASLRQVLAQVAKVAPTDSTVLILGETGTGKELIARAIHKRSRRASRAFIRVNCAAIPTSLIASELFGHEKGAFTGALQRRFGRFEAADGGTILLDEVGDLPAEAQVTLLRVLQEREIERVGSSHQIAVDVRVIVATNDAAKYPEVFANGLPPTQARAFATAQKPIAGGALGEPLTVAPAWKTVPSWYVVATQDRAINPELERFMAKRMNARVTELPAGHLVFISRAPDIARIIESASQ